MMKYDVNTDEVFVNGRWIDVDETEAFETTKVKRTPLEIRERKAKKKKERKTIKKW